MSAPTNALSASIISAREQHFPCSYEEWGGIEVFHLIGTVVGSRCRQVTMQGDTCLNMDHRVEPTEIIEQGLFAFEAKKYCFNSHFIYTRAALVYSLSITTICIVGRKA